MFRNTHRIVLTGGPGGGKTTAADLIRRELGETIVVVPEAATLLFTGGFPRSSEVQAQVSAQKAIYHIQKNMEDVIHTMYPNRILLCDRGTLDGAAYWPTGDGDYYESMETTMEKELSRYDAVIFFESAAVGNISIEGGNPIRVEDNKRAVDLDHKLKEVWSHHSCFVHVPHQKSFISKLKFAIDALEEAIEKLNGDIKTC